MILDVTLDARDATVAATQRAILASVPGGFRISDAGPADVSIVDGRDTDWVAAVERVVDVGVRGILLVRPGPADPDRVRGLSRAVAGRCVVAVDAPYAADPAWVASAGAVAADAAAAPIVDSVACVPAGDGLPGALLDQLAVVRPLVDLAGELRPVHRGAGQYVLVGGRGPRVSLTGVVSGTGRAGLTLDVVGPACRWQVRFDDTAPARPTTITRYDATGAHTRPPVYAGGRRATWQRLHAAVTGTGEVGYALDQLADDLRLAGRVYPATSGTEGEG